MPKEPLCHCGKPLHYNNLSIKKLITKLIEEFGSHILITDSKGVSYEVPRHYVALHGIKEQELSELGFEVFNAHS